MIAGKLSGMPHGVLAEITEFKLAQQYPHNLRTRQISTLTLNAVADGRKKEQADIAQREALRDAELGTTSLSI